MNDNGKEKQGEIKPFQRTMDSSRSTKMENKWAKDIPTQRNAQRHRLPARDTRKTQIYAYSNAENILLSIECTHVGQKDVHIE